MDRTNISSGSQYEKPIGFSRAVRIGNIIAIAGTAPIGADGLVDFPGDLYKQTQRCLDIILDAIEAAGGRPKDVIRTRIFLKDISQWEDAAKAHGEYFFQIRPACSFIEVSGFIDEEWLVEIEADCVLAEHE